MFNKLIVWYVFKTGCWNNLQKSWLVLTAGYVNHVFFMHMKHKIVFILFSDYNSFIHKQAFDDIDNLFRKKDKWVAAVYDNEWYPGVVVEVGWILAYIIEKLFCF